MIERVKLTANAKNQLITLKRKTGISHYNALCRHALCVSLANPSIPPEESLNFNGGLEIDWRTFTGGHEELYYNLIQVRLITDKELPDEEKVRSTLSMHVHRGLSLLSAKNEADLLELFRSMI
ncbi:DNA sulfur modification protein DndE [Pseudomonas sp. A-RE-26]|uniref:DNA sulfur modification protein DndE n=1 Tax=Pseudomonas sp. A-RE-26 TaxID=2832402 RepID=UPI001CBDD5CC|nr:DNA sulfur modification protein DndE [Pseudomonas sp. A-RE-26]